MGQKVGTRVNPEILPNEQDRVFRLRRLLQLNSRINSTLELGALLEIIMKTAADVMDAQTASLLLLNEQEQTLEFCVALGESGQKLKKGFSVKVGEGIAGQTASSGQTLIVNDAENDPRVARRFDASSGFKTRAILSVPVRAQGRLIGVLQAINPAVKPAFDAEDAELFEIFSDQAAIALENARLHTESIEKERMHQELQIARTIQENFLPRFTGAKASYSIAARTASARQVGGDLYEILDLPDRSLGILIGDVSGKGVPAALCMIKIISDFRLLAPHYRDPASMVRELNRLLLSKSAFEGVFVTLLYLILKPDLGKVIFSRAGHEAMILRRHDAAGPEILAGESGIPIGILEKTDFPRNELALGPKDFLLLYTDGVVETRNPESEEYGIKRLLHECADPDTDANLFLDRLYLSIDRFRVNAPQHDDITAVAIRGSSPDSRPSTG